MIYHSREQWQLPTQPINGPAPRPGTLRAVIHYTAAPNGITDGTEAQALRDMQASYLSARGYSLGYWAMIGRDGVAWQIRGPHPSGNTTYNPAANPGRLVGYPPTNANNGSMPILFTNGIDEPLTPAAINTAKQLWHQWGFRGRPNPHSQLDPTGCPGDPVRHQIAQGLLDVTDTPTPPPTEDPNMLIIWSHINMPGSWLVGAGTPIYLTPDLAEFYREAGIDKINEGGKAADDCRSAFIALSCAPL